jgi:3D (Asp-Asp-Asp) domain-containing protein
MKTLLLLATAYCAGTHTATGTRVSVATVAVDPVVVSLGSKLRIMVPRCIYRQWYGGIKYAYDVGSDIKGHRIDIFMADCRDARQFGHRNIRVQILR